MHLTKNERIKKKKDIIRNKKLIKKYPWLIPRNRWTDKIPNDYDYSWTELDSMEDGWRKAFGEMMCEEIQQELVKYNYVSKFRIMQLKEKYGRNELYVGYAPKSVHNIIEKYGEISEHVCCSCGKPDVAITNAGWILPMCEHCFKKQKWHNRAYEEFIDPEDDNRIPDSYQIKIGTKDKEWIEEYNIKETADKIRRNWEKREKQRKRAREKRTQRLLKDQ